MRPSSSILYAFAAMLLVICSQASPTLSALALPSSDIHSASPSLKAHPEMLYKCFDTRATMYRRAKFNDCAHALAQLPNLIEAKTFHTGGDPDADPYALPKIEVYHSCQVKVDLRFGRSDESSWLAINIATSKIMHACSLGYGHSQTTGGQITAGKESFIIITVETTQARVSEPGVSQNNTAVAKE